jgi:hypothetical protein
LPAISELVHILLEDIETTSSWTGRSLLPIPLIKATEGCLIQSESVDREDGIILKERGRAKPVLMWVCQTAHQGGMVVARLFPVLQYIPFGSNRIILEPS